MLLAELLKEKCDFCLNFFCLLAPVKNIDVVGQSVKICCGLSGSICTPKQLWKMNELWGVDFVDTSFFTTVWAYLFGLNWPEAAMAIRVRGRVLSVAQWSHLYPLKGARHRLASPRKVSPATCTPTCCSLFFIANRLSRLVCPRYSCYFFYSWKRLIFF